ncbi:MAG: DUF4956 domain-containing protein [Myxococcota bacterium]
MIRVIDRVARNLVGRLVIYYIACSAAFAGLLTSFPRIKVYIDSERLRGEGVSIDLDPNRLVDVADQQLSGVQNTFLDPYTTVPVLIALLSVMSMTIPVSWVYRWTRSANVYSSSIAQSLVILPIAITLAVFLVKGSLALAFSLAGIVAAIRFRTALNDSGDAVFMFVVIGIGLAAGVQLVNVSLIASIIFNFVVLLLWYLNYGDRPAMVRGWSLVDEERTAVDSALVHTPPDDVSRYNARLRLPTTDIEATQKSILPILEVCTKAWRFAQVTREQTLMVLELDVRLKKSVDIARIIRELENAALETGRVELKRIKREEPKAELAEASD